MFLTDKNSRLVKLNKVLYPDTKVSLLFNVDDSCYFAVDGKVCKYETDNNYRVIINTGTVIDIYQIQSSQDQIVARYADYSMVNMRKKVKCDGKIEFYDEENKVFIYKTDNDYYISKDGQIKTLFSSLFHVRFIHRTTPIDDENYILRIHTYSMSSGVLSFHIWEVTINSCKAVWYASKVICSGEILYTKPILRKSFMIVTTDNKYIKFEENLNLTVFDIEKHRICDNVVIEYGELTKIHY